jgi:hypothetical protein
MKVSKVIENLKYLQDTYGDLEVDVYLDETEDGDIETKELFFATDLEVITIQNVPFQ